MDKESKADEKVMTLIDEQIQGLRAASLRMCVCRVTCLLGGGDGGGEKSLITN